MQQLVSVAGGRASRRDDDQLEVIHAGDGVQDRIAKKVKWTESADLIVTPFDSVRVTSNASAFESGAVLLSGEFAQPGIYPVRRVKSSPSLSNGQGVTSQAFPYGAVFTRASVRIAQREGLQRALKELNTGLLSIAARKDISADAIIAAQELSQSIAGTEPPGRVVVEADPRVLAMRPDLDTVLEPGDTIFMPKRPNFVLTLGDVLNPTALQFSPRKSAKDYLDESGGVQSTADDKRTFIVYPNGIAEPVKRRSGARAGRFCRQAAPSSCRRISIRSTN
ncbi:capsule biosynthesis GfcC family protein [Hankyongella ginsenosidimutans]|uniref:capsule biosynthesis GfcC family protein n=1 Tax=Hankyongella ginsenosidimutans TaxID=1763828 RepID=UPI001CA38403|nr:capsule biosynthesis GfcC family protein [Hankyongella ginsenosidimutans]